MTQDEERRWRRLTNTIEQFVTAAFENGCSAEDVVDALTGSIIQVALPRLGSAELIAQVFERTAQRIREPDFITIIEQGITPRGLH